MTQEIRIRVWDKKNKEFVIQGDFIMIAGYLAGYHFDSNSEGDISIYEYQLSTGKKDKTGREIWSGDIVEVNGQEGQVEWENNLLRWHVGGNVGLALGDCWQHLEPKIVGNIYEK